VQITPEGLAKLDGRKLDLLPGMPAEVMVSTGSRTFLQYLMGPLSDVAARSFIEK
jgi:epimerase transport system membrane fusion protein